MNLLYEKQRLYGMMFRGDGGGGGGGGGDSGGPSGSSGASAEGSGSSSGPGGGPAGGPGSGSSGSGSSGSGSSSGGSSSSSSDAPTADMSGMVGVSDDGTTTTSMNDDGSVTVSADADPADPADPGSNGNHAGMFSNSVLNSIVNRGGAAATGLPVGLMNSTLAAIMGNHSTQNQASIINGIIGMMGPVGMLNGLASTLGIGSIGGAIAGMGGVPADSVASDPSAAGDGMPPALGGMFTGSGAGQGAGSGFNTAAMLGMSGGDPLLASLFREQGKSPVATNKFLKDIMKSENQYG